RRPARLPGIAHSTPWRASGQITADWPAGAWPGGALAICQARAPAGVLAVGRATTADVHGRPLQVVQLDRAQGAHRDGGLVFSGLTVFRWSQLAFGSPVKALGFVVLAGGVMTFCSTGGRTYPDPARGDDDIT